MSNEYTFPFSTCEKKTDDGVFAQPFSAIANIITCLIILYFLLKTENVHSFLLLLTLLVFEAFHAFSHMIHIEGPMQINITHILAYSVNVAMINLFYHFTKVFPSNLFLIYMLCLVVLDLYTFFNFNIIYYLITFLLIFISILFYYYPLLPNYIQSSIKLLFFVEILVVLLFLNESCNCQTMLDFYPDFPYHILIELAGMYVFYLICSNFYKL
jgi:hypothetical protein